MTEQRASQELAELIEANRRRLHILRVRVDQAGRNAEPADMIESQDIQNKIAALEQQQRALEPARRPFVPEEMARVSSEVEEIRRQIDSLGQRLPSVVGFLNRIRELQVLGERLSLARYPPVTVVSGPMGYGKTYLLCQLADDLQNEPWDCAFVECESLADPDINDVINVLASRLGCVEAEDWKQIAACLGKRISNQKPEYKVILLVDGIDFLPEDVRHQVLMGLKLVHGDVQKAKGECRVVLSGRSVENDLERVTEASAQRGALAFGHPGKNWYTEIPLSEFGKDVISELIKRVADRDFETWEYEAMSTSLLEITGGHPAGLVNIVTRDLNKTGWTFEKDPRARDYYFSSETNERLFSDYMSKWVKEIKRKVGDKRWEDFQAVCALRRFNLSILQSLIEDGAIGQFDTGEKLLGWLAGRHLIREQPPAMWGDAIARGVVVAEMRMIDENRKRYSELNDRMAKSFEGALDRLCEIYKRTHTFELQAPIIAYATELIYHELEAKRYLESGPDPEALFEKSLQEVIEKLSSLEDGIAQRVLDETKRDDEICLSREALDRVARTLQSSATATEAKQ